MRETPGRRKDAADSYLGTKALQEGLITLEQLKDALSEQARDLAERKEGVRPLGAILIAKKALTLSQVQALLHPPSRPAPAGSVSFGKYQLLKELGRGGMGVVYEALDSELGRKVAIKTMIVNPAADPPSAKLDEERFLREARLSAGLTKHPHIVSVYEAGVIQGRRYLAMEFIDGKPMDQWWEAPSVTLKKEIEVLRDAALAVHQAHEHDVIHRDLKPANILVDGKNEPHITDFGLAKMVGENLSVSLTGAGMVVGTPAYISPEQAQGLKSVDRRTDIYALGVILFEIVTGRHPFLGQTAMEILMKATKNPVPSASSLLKIRLAPDQAKGLDDICQKALAKKPADRYLDAAGFAADLTRWLKGEEVRAVVPPRLRPRTSAKKTWAAGSLAAVFLLGGALYVLRQGSSTPREPQKRADDEEKRRLTEGERVAQARAKAVESELLALKAKAQKSSEVKHPEALRPGLIGEYYAGANFDIPSLRRIDPGVSFQWNAVAPAWADAPAELFSTMRWRGYLRIPEAGQYTLQVITSDGLRLFLDEKEVFSRWFPQSGIVETAVPTLGQGYHAFLLEYLKSPGKAGITFSCKKVADSGESLPSEILVHDGTAFTPLSQKPTVDHADQAGLPGAQEAEKLPILESAPGATFVLPWGREKGFLLWGKANPGDRLKLQFDSRESGERTLILALGRAKNGGIVRIAVNGREVARDLDLYSSLNHFLEFEFKKVPLRQGANELEFTMIGTNPAASEWRAGDGVRKLSFDYLRFR